VKKGQAYAILLLHVLTLKFLVGNSIERTLPLFRAVATNVAHFSTAKPVAQIGAGKSVSFAPARAVEDFWVDALRLPAVILILRDHTGAQPQCSPSEFIAEKEF